jgi:hypothetical protein
MDTCNRAERCRDLAEECRRRATLCISIENRNRYLRIAGHSSALAQGREAEPKGEDRLPLSPRDRD